MLAIFKSVTRFLSLLASLSLSLTFISCEQQDDSSLESPYAYQPPSTLSDGWPVSSLESEAIDVSMIETLTQEIKEERFTGIHSMLIIRRGNLIYEEYFNGQQATDLHQLFSVTKSFSSAMIGVAVQEGLIKGEDKPLFEFFPNHPSDNPEKSQIQLRHLLSMTAGLQWDEWSSSYVDAQNSHWKMMDSPSQVAYVLDLPLNDTPGSRFTYSTGLSNLMAPIIEQAVTTTIREFAQEYFFEKLDITTYDWPITIDSYPSTGGTAGGLSLRPRDMAKLGQLYLDDGVWNNTQLLSPEWVESSVSPIVNVQKDIDYGYQWWVRSSFTKDDQILKEFDAVGDGGQWIFVFPELELVVAFTGGNNTWLVDGDKMFQPITMVNRYILPAVDN